MSHRRRAFTLERLESRLLMAADFGDAPTPYATTLAESGARHEAVGPQLGAVRDTEDDGVHSALANADGADDDGVSFGPLRVGQLGAEIVVTVQGAPAGARLDAWIDFNGDHSWGGPGEQIANNRAVVNGPNTLQVDVPDSAIAGSVIARFRLSTAGNLSTEGPAADGEIEDYAVAIARPAAAQGLFEPEPIVTMLADGAQSVFAADMDGDGDMDLLSASSVASAVDDEVAWFENNGSETFTMHIVDNAADGVRSVVAADIDGDGDMDILAAAETAGKILWYENNGSQAFTTRTVTTLASGAKTVVAADVDADGDIDVVAAHGNRIAWYENDGAQTFTQRLLGTPTTGTGVFGVVAADVDGDGDMDVAWSSVNDNIVGWYENNGIQTFTNHTITSTAMGARNIATADVDGDGDLDILSASADDHRIAWYENDGNKMFTTRTITIAALSAWSVAAADVDGDGDVDVVAASASDDTLALFVNDGTETFTRRMITTSTNAPRSVVIADIDGDGTLDVASASSADDKIAWFKNPPIQTNPTTADFDRDGDADGADFLLWQRALGNPATPPGSGGDGNGSGFVDAADLAVWRNGFGGVVTPGDASVAAAATLPPDFGDDAFLAADLMAPAVMAPEQSVEPISQPRCEALPTIRDAAFAILGSANSHIRGARGPRSIAATHELLTDLADALCDALL